MKTFRFYFKLLGMIITLLKFSIVVYNYLINEVQPTNFDVMLTLILYMIFFIKLRDEP